MHDGQPIVDDLSSTNDTIEAPRDSWWLSCALGFARSACLIAVQDAINSRPRKVLGWKTPAEALNEQLLSLHHAGVASTD